MAEAFPKERPKLAAGNDTGQPADDLKILRGIIVGPEKTRIHRLEKRLDDSGTRADELSRVLPDAIARCTLKDQKIARSLQPTIEESIRVSVQKNPEVLADAIFPLMGPGIRKAIASTIMGMIQSFNQLLNHSFSIQGLKWRVEALRTRRPYAEILLLNTLLYQVEQVFLIHRKNGLVLQHGVGPSVKFQDPDLVSGMLTAMGICPFTYFGLNGRASIIITFSSMGMVMCFMTNSTSTISWKNQSGLSVFSAAVAD